MPPTSNADTTGEVPKILGFKLKDLRGHSLGSGTTIIQVERNSRENFVVLGVVRGTAQPFFTGLLQPGGGWISGHYFDDINEAVSDWLERIP